MRTEEIIVTPEMAKKWLEHNFSNRPVTVGRVALYARDMKAGNWQFNGETVSIDTNGNIRDGQHRLRACVVAGTPFKTLVNYDVDPGVTLYDRGKSRSTVDSLVIGGMDNKIANNTFVSVAKTHYLIQTGRRHTSDAEVKAFMEKYKEQLDAIASLRSVSRRGNATKIAVDSAIPMTAAFYAYCCGESIETLSRFLQVVATGFYDGESELAAVVIRNDIIKRVVNFRGAANERMWGVFKVEKAISDFADGIPRRRSYKAVQEQTYSNDPKFKED